MLDWCIKCYNKKQYETGAKKTISCLIRSVVPYDETKWEEVNEFNEKVEKAQTVIDDEYLEAKYLLDQMARKIQTILKKKNPFYLSNF